MKSDDLNPRSEETPDDDPAREGPHGISRRGFLRNAALGTAAAGAAFALGGVGEALAQTEDSGDVTVDGVMLTYVASPVGSIGSSTWTIAKSHANTMTVVGTQNRGISISSDINVGITDTFSVGGSTTFRQNSSTTLSNGITLRRSSTQSITTPAPGAVGNTVILGLRSPQMHFRGNTSALRFKFLSALEQFAITVSDFQNNATVRSLFSVNTINSFLAQYPLVNDPAGTTLIKPRFKLRLSQLLSAGVTDVFTFTKATGSSYSTSKTSTISVEIKQSTGFNIFSIVKVMLSVGQTLEFTQTSVQEFTTDVMITLATTLNRTSLGVSKVFWDRVWKTFVIQDKGAPNAGQPTVAGTILDGGGFPIPGAYVTVTQDNADWGGRTDGSGNYTIMTATGDPLSTGGSYPINCAGTSQNVFLGSGTTDVDFYGADPVGARNTNYGGEVYNLN